MARKVQSPQKLEMALLNEMQTLAATLSRSALFSAFGRQYGGDRDMYEALGYPGIIEHEDYLAKYQRDIGKRIVNAPADATWRGFVQIIEDESTDETAFEKAWRELENNTMFFNKARRVDRMAGLGHYGVLLIGFSDVTTTDDLAKPVQKSSNLKVHYVQPYAEQSTAILEIESDMSNPRYGLPKMYQVQSTLRTSNGFVSSTTETTTTSRAVRVHWSRIIHIAEGLLEDDIYGTPRLQAVYNRLLDIEKVAGGSGEMYWRGARPGYAAIADKEAQFTPQDSDAVKTQLQEFNHNLTRFLRLKGMTIQDLAPQVVSPKDHLEVQLMLVSVITGMPRRILTGSERGELASTQDETNWKEQISDRRDDYAEPLIIRAFIDRCIEFGALPEADYQVVWPDLMALGRKEKAEIGLSIARALKEYVSGPGADMVMPPNVFLEVGLGLDKQEIERIEEAIAEEFDGDQGDVVEEEPEEEVVVEEPETNSKSLLKRLTGK